MTRSNLLVNGPLSATKFATQQPLEVLKLPGGISPATADGWRMRHEYETKLDAQQLAALAAVIELGSVDVAAERLHVTGGDGVPQRTRIALAVNADSMATCAKLQQDPSIDHIIALDASIALTTVQSKNTAGSTAVVDTFDTNAELVTAIKNGDIGWAVDQQPFLQGYLAIESLWLYINNRNTIGGGTPVLTGPAFIDSSNIESIAKYAANGTR